MLLVSTVAFAAPAAAGEPADDDGDTTVQTLDNGEDLFLVFGAQLDDQTLEEYVEKHASGEVDTDAEDVADVLEYEDVDEVDVTVQGNSAAISMNGGDAMAMQDSTQSNINEQIGEATSENYVFETHEASFEDVDNVYVVVGNDDAKTFDGWAVTGDSHDGQKVAQKAWASVAQGQEVDQMNYNQQSVAFALAEDESNATAYQQTTQYNENQQQGVANATNIYEGSDELHGADSEVYQDQDVTQTNVNEQGFAVAIAVGEDSSATAVQISDQRNVNLQYGSAQAVNVLATMAGMSTAVAGNGDELGLSYDEFDLEEHEKKADKKHDEKDDKKHDKKDDKKDEKKDDKKDEDVFQQAQAEVTQYQNASQLNVNLQSNAVAIATDGSDADAVQISHQQNHNVQLGYAQSVNVYLAGGHQQTGAVYTDEFAMTIDGNDATDNPMLSYDHAAASAQQQHADQHASAVVDQVQFVSQENLIEQHNSIAVAEDGEEASATQVSFQVNENVQFSSAQATNLRASI